jgi:DNA-3-methyladenine glycosylase
MPRILPRRFFSREPFVVAPDLIGKELVRDLENEKSLRGIIVEVEAYAGYDDPASHAFRGPTERNRVMFGMAGVAYVYFTYGFHYCLNVVTGVEGVPSAVLIRAVEPTEGEEVMKRNRKFPKSKRDLTSGPGKICQAFGLDRSFNGVDLTSLKSNLRIENPGNSDRKIATSQRVGIKTGLDKVWRFYDSESEYVSGKRTVGNALVGAKLI